MIKRKILNELRKHLKSPEITMLVGPRQAGKTTVLKILEGELKQKGEKTLFLNLDVEEDRRHLRTQKDLIDKLRLEFGGSKGFVFIDEIQRKENAGLFLKGIYDMELPYKFIVSGSGSVELKEKVKESLAGRKRIFELSTVDLEEFVNYRTGYRYEDRLDLFFRVESELSHRLLKEYLNYGGYPRVVTSETHEEKLLTIEEIFSSYIDRDIRELVSSERIDVYGDLIRLLAVKTGMPVHLTELSSALGVSLPTLKNYLWYAEKTFIVGKIRPFFRNRSKELVKLPIFYFTDVGLRNFASGQMGFLTLPDQLSLPFRNHVYNIAKTKIRGTGASLHYWRTKSGAEVDFVIKLGNRAIPIEVKFKELKEPKLSRSLRSFIRKYKPSVAIVISLTSLESVSLNGCRVKFLNIFEFMSSPLPLSP